ncbi:MAG TPA: ABC transporter permease [Acidobacteriota bacterium]|nr:ABC transporter permease [Acidobacteriota bacterium]
MKTVWRHLGRYKGYSLVNIIGLAVGLACCLLIMIWVQHEFSFDRFHARGDRIFRVFNELTLNAQVQTIPVTSGMLGPTAVQSIPEAEAAVRFIPMGNKTVKYGEKEFREDRILYADPDIFSVFSFLLIAGQPDSALAAPDTAVITEKTARKYFGAESPLGKVVKIGGHPYSITGVMADVPRDSHLRFDVLCSFKNYAAENRVDVEYWGSINIFTYLLLAPEADSDSLLVKLNRLSEEKIGKSLKKINGGLKVFLQPLCDIHLDSQFEQDIAETSDRSNVILFAVAAFFILLIACINFINLTTARFADRALDVGLRKTLGASRGSLIMQFFAESFVVALLAALLAVLLASLALPLLNAISGQDFSQAVLGEPLFLAGVTLLTALVGVLAGSYPALFLSSFAPVQTLRGRLKTGAASATFRKTMVVGQFAVSIALIIGTITVFKQLDFLRNKHLGFNKEQVMVLPLPYSQSVSPATARDEFATVRGISGAALSSDLPGRDFNMRNFVPEGRTPKEAVLMQTMNADDRFVTTLGLLMAKGRNFSPEMKTDPDEAVLINETAMARLGWQDPQGKTISLAAISDGKTVYVEKRIVGVLKDFHTLSLHQKIEPLAIDNSMQGPQLLSLRFEGQRLPDIMAALKDKWRRLFPDMAFDSFFLDESFARMYQAEERLNKIFTSFAVLAIFISCMGLFGLAAYMTEKRTKEVGIRKTLGASVSGIVFLLSREFGQWVLLANLVSWPLAYVFLSRWLEGFAYRTDIGIAVFILSGFLALLVAWLTVCYQAVRAARANPVDSLRYE